MRRFVTIAAVAAIALAGVLPPHFARAASHPAPLAQPEVTHHHAKDASHHHVVVPCDDGGIAHKIPAVSDYACCAAACAAIAFIFNQIAFTGPQPYPDYAVMIAPVLILAPAAAIDPPPRTT